jgi:hypothetical protein
MVGIALVLLSGLLGGSAVVMAQDEKSGALAGGYCIDGKTSQLVPGEEVNGILLVTEAEAQKMSQMSPEAEAAIIHEVPPCPFIIDGTLYKPEQIHLFDGQRLGFTVGNDGQLYAFTNEEGLEKFLQEQINKNNITDGTRDTLSFFYKDWYYGGDNVFCSPGVGFATLGPLDNAISSFTANSAASKIRLYENTYLQGDYFERPGGDSISVLYFFGWNDRASSVFAYN